MSMTINGMLEKEAENIMQEKDSLSKGWLESLLFGMAAVVFDRALRHSVEAVKDIPGAADRITPLKSLDFSKN